MTMGLKSLGYFTLVVKSLGFEHFELYML